MSGTPGMHRRVPASDMGWCLTEARRLRALDAAAETRRYAAAKAARKPWLSVREAAKELDVTEARISQLAKAGTFAILTDSKDRRYRYVRAADVYAYTPTPAKKTRTKTK